MFALDSGIENYAYGSVGDITLSGIAAQNAAGQMLIELMNASAPREDGLSWTWSESLTWVQQSLINQGFLMPAEDAAGPSGLFDWDTRVAIETFQRSNGLDGGNPDYWFGILDEATLAAIAQGNAAIG